MRHLQSNIIKNKKGITDTSPTESLKTSKKISDCRNTRDINNSFLSDIKNSVVTTASPVDNVLAVKPVATTKGGYSCIGTDTRSNLGFGHMLKILWMD